MIPLWLIWLWRSFYFTKRNPLIDFCRLRDCLSIFLLLFSSQQRNPFPVLRMITALLALNVIVGALISCVVATTSFSSNLCFKHGYSAQKHVPFISSYNNIHCPFFNISVSFSAPLTLLSILHKSFCFAQSVSSMLFSTLLLFAVNFA